MVILVMLWITNGNVIIRAMFFVSLQKNVLT